MKSWGHISKLGMFWNPYFTLREFSIRGNGLNIKIPGPVIREVVQGSTIRIN